MVIGYLIAAVLMLAPGVSLAQNLPGDAAAGRALAIQTCAGCHAVAQDQRRPALDGVPAFLTLARDPAITELSLRAFLQTPHARMPSIMLSRREIDDVISYILSMRVAN
jgi:mono/diheme cytochrome c family protein